MTSSTVEAMRLTKHYGGRTAVEDVSLRRPRARSWGCLAQTGLAKQPQFGS